METNFSVVSRGPPLGVFTITVVPGLSIGGAGVPGMAKGAEGGYVGPGSGSSGLVGLATGGRGVGGRAGCGVGGRAGRGVGGRAGRGVGGITGRGVGGITGRGVGGSTGGSVGLTTGIEHVDCTDEQGAPFRVQTRIGLSSHPLFGPTQSKQGVSTKITAPSQAAAPEQAGTVGSFSQPSQYTKSSA